MPFFLSLRIHIANLKSALVIISCFSLLGCINEELAAPSKKEIKVVIAGSYRKSIDNICKIKEKMEKNGINVLEPLCGKVLNKGADFIVFENDKAKVLDDDAFRKIEKRFIAHCREADYIYLYNDNLNGYVGLSAAFEIGFAKGIGKKVYTSTVPKDKGLQISDFAEVLSVNDFINKIRNQP